jgi:hypothetical protein
MTGMTSNVYQCAGNGNVARVINPHENNERNNTTGFINLCISDANRWRRRFQIVHVYEFSTQNNFILGRSHFSVLRLELLNRFQGDLACDFISKSVWKTYCWVAQ